MGLSVVSFTHFSIRSFSHSVNPFSFNNICTNCCLLLVCFMLVRFVCYLFVFCWFVFCLFVFCLFVFFVRFFVFVCLFVCLCSSHQRNVTVHLKPCKELNLFDLGKIISHQGQACVHSVKIMSGI